jgi:SAM-dependent methyltransferase
MIQRALIGPGIVLCSVDKVVSMALRRRPQARMDEKLDKTGRVTQTRQALNVRDYDPNIRCIYYPGNFNHSMWRSQELSLITRHKDLLARPRLDFGCGDGSFASSLFERVDYGIDNDRESLRVARQYGVYEQLACSDGATLPIKSQSVRSIFSNSVLEHVDKLQETISGLYNVLVPDGIFVFTVPVLNFATHLSRYFGQQESDQINQRWYHRHMHPAGWWNDLLQQQGFEVKHIQPYQPDWFTLAYFAFSTRPFLLLYRCGLAENERYRQLIARMIANSIADTVDGGNILVIAQRPMGG